MKGKGKREKGRGLYWLLRVGRTRDDCVALVGDLDEEYRARAGSDLGWLRAEIWYASEVLAALWCGARDAVVRHRARPPGRSLLARLFYPADVRYAIRRWRRRPAFALTAVVTLALGVGATTAIYSVVDAVILRPLPWPEADRLVVIHGVYPERRQNPLYATTWNRGTFIRHAWDALREGASLGSVATWRPRTGDDTYGEGRTEMVTAWDVSSNYLPLLGARIIEGRGFTPEDDENPTYTAVLPFDTWRRRFGEDPAVVGQTLVFGSASSGGRYPRTIVGILEPGVRLPGGAPEFLFNIGTSAKVERTYNSGSLRVLARLRDGASIEAAGTEAAGATGALAQQEPLSARVVPLADEELGTAARPLWVLFAAAGLLFFVACSNVAGLLVGEGRARRHEFGVRRALGGSRLRLIRQLVVEHGLLSLAGSAAGLLLAFWLTEVLVSLAPGGLPRIGDVAIDARIAVLALLGGTATIVLFGVAPAWTLSRTPAARVIAEGGRDGGAGRHVGQRALVSLQMALALTLLIGAALFGETIFRLTSQPLGFDHRNLAVIATTHTGLQRFGDPSLIGAARRDPSINFAEFMDQQRARVSSARNAEVREALEALPGVAAVTAAWAAPIQSLPVRSSLRFPGRPPDELPRIRSQSVAANYFDVMGIRVEAGRAFNPTDVPGAPVVAVVSREFARQFLPEPAVSSRFDLVYGQGQTRSYEVVGVVGDVRVQRFHEDIEPIYYTHDGQQSESRQFLVRSRTEALALLPAIRRAIADVDPQIVVTSATTMEELVGRTVAHERFRATLAAWFGGAALVLAAVGLYGLAARRVSERRREFGVRVALGAAPANLRTLVFRDALAIVATGLALGVPAAFAASQLTQAFLFGVSSTAPHVFSAAAITLALAALAATVAPARRASRLDPVGALKDQ